MLAPAFTSTASSWQMLSLPALDSQEGLNRSSSTQSHFSTEQNQNLSQIVKDPDSEVQMPGRLLLTESINETLPSRLQLLEKIPISFGNTWLTDSTSGLINYDVNFKFPLLRFFGSPPPIVNTGFSFTDLRAGPNFGLPRELYEYSVGVTKVFPLNERWTIRSTLGVTMATDNRNRSSDAWQFRGSVFGVYKANEKWQWSVGAIALGRDDLPVVPGVGAIWTPNDRTRWDLIPPNPKVNFLIHQTDARQHWAYLGFGFRGTTWGYRTKLDLNDRLTYGDLRVITGWQIRPQAAPDAPFVRGRKYDLQLGYVFSRDLEWNHETIKMSLDDAWMIRFQTRY